MSTLAAITALRAYLDAGLGAAAEVLVGWPEERPRDLDTLPRVSVSQVGQGGAAHMRPEVIAEELQEDGTVDQHLAFLEETVTVQLDVWAAYQAARDALVELVAPLLDNQLPFTTGLILPGLEPGQDVRWEVVRHSRADGARGPGLSEWRATWLIRALIRRAKVFNNPRHDGGGTADVDTDT